MPHSLATSWGLSQALSPVIRETLVQSVEGDWDRVGEAAMLDMDAWLTSREVETRRCLDKSDYLMIAREDNSFLCEWELDAWCLKYEMNVIVHYAARTLPDDSDQYSVLPMEHEGVPREDWPTVHLMYVGNHYVALNFLDGDGSFVPQFLPRDKLGVLFPNMIIDVLRNVPSADDRVRSVSIVDGPAAGRARSVSIVDDLAADRARSKIVSAGTEDVIRLVDVDWGNIQYEMSLEIISLTAAYQSNVHKRHSVPTVASAFSVVPTNNKFACLFVEGGADDRDVEEGGADDRGVQEGGADDRGVEERASTDKADENIACDVANPSVADVVKIVLADASAEVTKKSLQSTFARVARDFPRIPTNVTFPPARASVEYQSRCLEAICAHVGYAHIIKKFSHIGQSTEQPTQNEQSQSQSSKRKNTSSHCTPTKKVCRENDPWVKLQHDERLAISALQSITLQLAHSSSCFAPWTSFPVDTVAVVQKMSDVSFDTSDTSHPQYINCGLEFCTGVVPSNRWRLQFTDFVNLCLDARPVSGHVIDAFGISLEMHVNFQAQRCLLHIFKADFIRKIKIGDDNHLNYHYAHKELQRIEHIYKAECITDIPMLIFPICVDGQWSLHLWNKQTCAFEVYDSFNPVGAQYNTCVTKVLRECLQAFVESKGNSIDACKHIEVSDTQIVVVPSSLVPQQLHVNDSGALMMHTLYYRAQRESIWQPVDMQQLRLFLACCTHSKRIPLLAASYTKLKHFASIVPWRPDLFAQSIIEKQKRDEPTCPRFPALPKQAEALKTDLHQDNIMVAICHVLKNDTAKWTKAYVIPAVMTLCENHDLPSRFDECDWNMSGQEAKLRMVQLVDTIGLDVILLKDYQVATHEKETKTHRLSTQTKVVIEALIVAIGEMPSERQLAKRIRDELEDNSTTFDQVHNYLRRRNRQSCDRNATQLRSFTESIQQGYGSEEEEYESDREDPFECDERHGNDDVDETVHDPSTMSVQTASEKFKALAARTPTHECSCCRQLFFEHSMTKLPAERMARLSENVLRSLTIVQEPSHANVDDTERSAPSKAIADKSEQSRTIVDDSERSHTIVNDSERSFYIDMVGYRFCNTCAHNLRNNRIPKLSTANGMCFPEMPESLARLTELEERLVAPRQAFAQFRKLSRGGQQGLKGSVVNVPANNDIIQTLLPRLPRLDQTVGVRLKRKLEYAAAYNSSTVRPVALDEALDYLVQQPLYQKEGVRKFHAHEELLDAIRQGEEQLQDEFREARADARDQTTDPDEWGEVPHAKNPRLPQQTMIHNYTSARMMKDQSLADELTDPSKPYNVAPSEGMRPLGLFQDRYSEELNFPRIFCGKAREDYCKRSVRVSYKDICKWELRAADRRAATCTTNIFFKLRLSQIHQVRSAAWIRVRKSKMDNRHFTAGELRSSQNREELLRADIGYHDLIALRTSPDYYDQLKKSVFAMMRQLGTPTWFFTFSAADLHWYDLIAALAKTVDGKTITEDEAKQLSYDDKNRLIAADPVTCARYYRNRMDAFRTQMLENCPEAMGGLVDFFLRDEFQQRGSPHSHGLAWVDNAPIYGVDSDEDVIAFIDKHVSAQKDGLPHNMVFMQEHRHTKYCQKCNKLECRFSFPRPPLPRTMILKPFHENEMTEHQLEVCKRNWTTIYEYLAEIHPDDVDKHTYDFDTFLAKLDLSLGEYVAAIRSHVERPTVLHKRNVRDIRINPYGINVFEHWGANMDMQFVLDPYAAAMYVVSYMMKGQRGLSQIMDRTIKECNEKNATVLERIRQSGNAFMNAQEICAQEAVYLLLGLPLKQSSRDTIFINTNRREKRAFVLKSEKELENLPAESADIAKPSLIDRYVSRPADMQDLCLADFACKYDRRRSSGNGGNGQYRLRSRAKVFRSVRFNERKEPEEFYRELYMLYVPFTTEAVCEDPQLMGFTTNFDRYEAYKDQIQARRDEYEKIAKWEEIQAQVQDDATQRTQDSEDWGYNGMPLDDGEEFPLYDCDADLGGSRTGVRSEKVRLLDMLPDDEYFALMRTLNPEQRAFHNHVLQ